ncbi:o-succinylbenzoate--CoA ligase [Nostocoides sp. HKS02]|uniref:o-succinylbenzoate--CoA ligase n=1 Tax=Nostocoides sp. HKS02 TaxID=1813880 RepID=UPI0012B46952|nr:o-succinylbenzoate--CoA ligase [Tetrasphaera sp. HKS02]QGN58323.1 AMP-binding protein [Tetrasphaera sp. HKS02]
MLRRALDGEFAALPYAAGSAAPPLPDRISPDDGTALVVGTSGSTGTPKLAMLPASALRASADATHERLGGPGTWLLAMPPHHIAGVQVMLRCIAADTQPAFVDLTSGFRPAAFAEAVTALPGDRRYTALVPTQLVRVLADDHATRAAATLDAVLVGGAASSPTLLTHARDAGITVVTTYGMSETAGGCVYDGVPLRPSRVSTAPDGRLHLGGATLASGYLGQPDLSAAVFVTDADGLRWFRTDDAGHQDADGRWRVDGRLDDLITTGGLKVSPRLVEEALLEHLDAVEEVVVVGTPDPEWGELVAAAVTVRAGAAAPTASDARTVLRGILPDHALPRRLVVLEVLPLRGPGKPDRRALREALATHDTMEP